MRRVFSCICLLLLIPAAAVAASRDEARQQLSQMNIPFTQQKFELVIWQGQNLVVELFLDAGMDANLRESDSNWPILTRAVTRNHVDVVNALLKHGANVNARGPFGVTALMYASHASFETIKALLDAGAAVDARDEDRATALMYAADGGRTATVKILLDHGANINAKGSISKNADSTALHYAALAGHADTISELLHRGSDPNAKNADGMTPLMWASFSADIPSVKALLDAGADPSARSNNGRTTAWERAIFSQRRGIDVIRLLIERKANINLTTNDGHTPLDFANLKGDAEIVTLLEANGAKTGHPW
jgi:ankyrin repeat protein